MTQNTKTKSPFADTNPAKKIVSKDRNKERMENAVSRLVRDADFKLFMFHVIYGLYGFKDDLVETCAFDLGKRASAAYIRRLLLQYSEEAPQFLSDLEKRYFDGVRKGIEEAARKQTGETR